MINHNDQMDLFKLIGKQIKRDIECYVFGGTAMMFYGYKEETKDIDILFKTEEERDEFLNVIKNLGFVENNPIKIYVPEKLKDKHKPLMFVREDYRIDIFVKKIFKTIISPKMEEDIFAVHEFKDKFTFEVNVLRTEHIVMLKGVTERDKDFADILTIVKKDTNFDWQYLIDEVIWQYNNGDGWILFDTEKTLRELKEYIYLENRYLKQLEDVVKKSKK